MHWNFQEWYHLPLCYRYNFMIWVNFSHFLLEWASLPANCRFGIFPINKYLPKGWTFVRDYLLKRFWIIFCNKSAFFFNVFLAFWGTFIKAFDIYKRRLCKIESKGWSKGRTICSINLKGSSTGTGTEFSAEFLISSNFFQHSHLKFSVGIFPWLLLGLTLVRSAP